MSVEPCDTAFAGPPAAGAVAGRPLDVFVAGADEGAKATVSALVSFGGPRPLDVGPLRRARELGGLPFLHRAAQDRLGPNWSSGVAVLP